MYSNIQFIWYYVSKKFIFNKEKINYEHKNLR